MGRPRNKGRTRNRGGYSRPREQNPRGDSWVSFSGVVKENEKLQRYYDGLLQLPDSEKEEFWAAFRRDLPNSFRFCGSKGHALAVRRLLQKRYIPEIQKIEHYDGTPVSPPEPLSWYPDSLAWWMTTPKSVIRKFPPFKDFQKFLVSETSVGNISRQEVVSMIPPLLMDLRPGMVVLDMCAAPGSKAAQLLEMIHQGEEARIKKALRAFSKEDGLDLGPETEDEASADLEADPSDAGRATGLLIANDSDYKRGHMLVHQLKRLSSPNLIVTNHDATLYPSLKLPSPPDTKAAVYLKFDRILADVPCSGDGTLRKNMNLWKDWVPGGALGLHLVQTRILVRALQMLKVGGRVVYSTCSMNPVENEAVIVSAIERCGGPEKVDIIDCSDQLTGLKRAPGLKTWTVMDKSARIWESWRAVEEHVAGQKSDVWPGKLAETMFPRTVGGTCSDLPLERCMRVYPHFQDTGGFFITVLEKKAEFRALAESEPKNPVIIRNGPESGANGDSTRAANGNEDAIGESPAEGPDSKKESLEEPPADAEVLNGAKRPLEDDVEDEPESKKIRTEAEVKPEEKNESSPNQNGTDGPGKRGESTGFEKKNRGPPLEEPFKYLKPGHEVTEDIKQFYGLSPRFPGDRWMVRNAMGEPAKAIYYTSALARDILTENEGRSIKFIHGGVRMFMKQDAPSAGVCRWRIQSEGIPIVQGYVGEQRIVRLRNKETLRGLLIEMFPKIGDGEWAKMADIGERVRDMGMGCCVLRVEPDGDDEAFAERVAMPLWKSHHSLNLMLPKEDRAAMLLRVFNDTTPLVNNTLKKAKAEAEEKEEEDAAQDAMDVEDLPTP